MRTRERATYQLLIDRGVVTAADLSDHLGTDRFSAYLWLRGVAQYGFLHADERGAFSLACPLPQREAAA